MSKFFRKAQDAAGALPPPPPPPPPPAGGAPPMGGGMDLGLGAPPMGGIDPMAGAAPPPPPPGGTERQEIIGPITTLTQIFYDMDVAKFIQNNLQIDSKKLTEKIWQDYGGNEDGTVDPNKFGQRTDDDLKLDPDAAKKERDNTKNSKWERLELNKTIEDIVTYADLGKVVEGLMFGVIQKAGQSAAAPPGGAPPGGALAANKARIIIAQNLEHQKLHFQVDQLLKEIKF